MTQETALTTRQDVFALPEIAVLKRELAQVRMFQAAVKELLIEGSDWGVIPGTSKPTLLKPGAEKIDKILKLADTYEEVSSIEDWDKPLFYYKIKCRLLVIGTDIVISEGMGSCSSMEGKYRYRWVGERDIPAGIDKTSLPHQERRAQSGGHWTVYQVENDDIYTQANTILKMAKKRAHIDASLSAGRLSDIFTQDIEDMGITEEEVVVSQAPKKSPDKTSHWCEKHQTEYFKKGKMKGYAHPIGDTGEWCNEEEDFTEYFPPDGTNAKQAAEAHKKAMAELKPAPSPDAPEQVLHPVIDEDNGNPPEGGELPEKNTNKLTAKQIDTLKEELKKAGIEPMAFGRHCKEKGWEDIKKYSDLEVWQLEELKVGLSL